MSVLDSVLQYKARKEAQEAQAAQAIPQAVQAFITGRQEAQNNQLKMLSVQAELAGKGLKLTPQGIMRDESLTSPLEQLVSQSKAAEAAKTMGNRPLWESLTGQGSQQAPQQPQATGVQDQQPAQSSSLIDQMQAPEVDPFTGKPTTRGVQQEASNKSIEAQISAENKMKVPTAKMKEDLNSTLEQINAFKELRKEAEASSSGWNSVLVKSAGFFTRGANAPNLAKIPGLGDLNKIEAEKLYSDNRPAMSTSLYKALTGDTRLSDFDSKRALSLTWEATEAKNIRTKKFDKIERMLNARANLIKQGRYSVNKEGEFITPLNAIEAEAENMSKGTSSNSSFKAGDVRSKNGQNYVRQEDGSWLPQ